MLRDGPDPSYRFLPGIRAFSSGVVVIQTRRAADTWKMRLNNVDPTFRTRRGSEAT